jgi:hypothetical protein
MLRSRRNGYLLATQHPWPCLLFLLPLLLAYEAGVVWFGGPRPEAVRNGADSWLRWGLESFGFPQFYCAPALIIAALLVWSAMRLWSRPDHLVLVWLGMAVESIVFAGGLWLLSRQLGPFLDEWGVHLNMGIDSKTLARIITFVGAGIYEEAIFRLALFFVLGCLLRLIGIGRLFSALLTTIASAVIFAVAHHIGPYGEPYDGYVFLFRALAGLYFALLYLLRGFGIVVGAHVCYDVLVGVCMVQ